MLGALILENFKPFGTRQMIPLAPITLIFGANSAGKSAILQALLLLKQSLDQADPQAPTLLARGPLVDVGSFQDMLFRHDSERVLEIAPLVRGDAETAKTGGGLGPKLEGLVGVGLQFGFDSETRNFRLEALPCYVRDVAGPLFRLVTESSLDTAEDAATAPEERAEHRAPRSTPTLARIHDLDEASPIWNELYTALREWGATSMDGESDRFSWADWALPALELILQQWQVDPELIPTSGPLREILHGGNIPVEGDIGYDFTIDAYEYLKKLDPVAVEQFLSHHQQFADLNFDKLVGYDSQAKEAGELIDDLLAMIRGYQYMIKRRRGETEILKAYLRNYPFSKLLLDLHAANNLRPVELQGMFPDDFPLYGLRSPSDEPELVGPVGSFTLALESGGGHSYGINPHVPRLERTASAMASWQRSALSRLAYLGPLRQPPARYYIYGNEPPSGVGKSGQFLPDLLFSRQDLVEAANRSLQTFGLGYHLHVTRSRDPNMPDLFSVRLIDDTIGANLSMLDVGVGVSQVLPIVLETALATNRIMLIEQPELHLHPRLQAELGDLFIDAISNERGNQFIIETHSEHLILRLQRRVRDGTLRPDDLSVVYVLKGPEGSQCVPLRLDAEGDFIDEWPEGFFEESYREMFA